MTLVTEMRRLPAEQVRSPAAVGPADAVPSVHVLEGFRVCTDGEVDVDLPPAGQRLLAFLALHTAPCSRARTCAELWPDADEAPGAAALRSTLWRLRQVLPEVVHSASSGLFIDASVAVDVRRVRDLAGRLARPGTPVTVAELDPEQLIGSLLPGWYDEWVLVEREALRQLQLHALEALTERLLLSGQPGPAAVAALAAVRMDPLRESAYRALVHVHLAEGNASEALRAYDQYRDLLWRELRVEPSQHFARLLGPLLAGRRTELPGARRATPRQRAGDGLGERSGP